MVGSPDTKLENVKASNNYTFGANFQHNPLTVSTSGTAVTVTSGLTGYLTAGMPITINGVVYTVASTNFSSQGVLASPAYTLQSSAGTQTGVSANIENTNYQIIGGEYNNNGKGGATDCELYDTPCAGISTGGASTGTITGVTASDTNASGSKTQYYGIETENTAQVQVIGGTYQGNITAPTLIASGNQPNIIQNPTLTGQFDITGMPNTAYWSSGLNIDTLYTFGWYVSYNFAGTLPTSGFWTIHVVPAEVIADTYQFAYQLNVASPAEYFRIYHSSSWSAWVQLSTGSSGSGTVSSGTIYSPAYYTSTGATVGGVTPFAGLPYYSTSAAPAVATAAQNQ